MAYKRKVFKKGDSLLVRIPKKKAERIGLTEGSWVKFRVADGKIVMEKTV